MNNQGDNFRVIFPLGATKEHKALLMAAALFLDYRFFEKGSDDMDNGGMDVNIF